LMGEHWRAAGAAETQWEGMAMEEAGLSQDLRNSAFEACVKAYALLPDNNNYERAAIEWSNDYGALRKLRHRILVFIVQEAGKLCNPYGSYDDLHDRIQARLGRTKKLDLASMQWSEDPEKMARLAALPLFSESTDDVLVSAYKELMPGPWSDKATIPLRLSGLNFMRLLTPNDYPTFVADFIERLRMTRPSEASEYLGPFSGFSSKGYASWRTVLHEHLDAVMPRKDQRELVRGVYGKWIEWVEKERDETLCSLFDDEIRIRFSENDIIGAYKTACKAEDDGIYRHDDAHGALVLRRTAQWVSQISEDDPSDINALRLKKHLDDNDMKHLAEEHFDMKYEWDGNDDWGPQIPAVLDRWELEESETEPEDG